MHVFVYDGAVCNFVLLMHKGEDRLWSLHLYEKVCAQISHTQIRVYAWLMNDNQCVSIANVNSYVV